MIIAIHARILVQIVAERKCQYIRMGAARLDSISSVISTGRGGIPRAKYSIGPVNISIQCVTFWIQTIGVETTRDRSM